MANTFRSLICLTALLCLPAYAQAQSTTVNATSDDIAHAELDKNEFMVTARIRAVHVPDSVLGIWFDNHSSTWANGQQNLSYGGEFTWRRRGDYELSIGVDWADLSTKDAFWLEQDDPASASKYTEVDLQLLSVVFASYWYWNPTTWLSPYVGGGIGAGFVLGDIIKYRPRPGSNCLNDLGSGDDPFQPPSCYAGDGKTPDTDQIDFDNEEIEEDIPPVVPVLHLAGGLRFNIYKYGVIKLEVGINDYVYGGLSVGGQW